MRYRIRFNEKGVSLIEGVLYLVIALAVIVGGIVFFNQAQIANQVSSTSRVMTLVSARLVAIEAKNPTVSSSRPITNSGRYALNAEIVPANFAASSGDRLVAPWGGEITIYTRRRPVFGTPDRPVVTAIMQDVPTEACMRFSQMNASGYGPAGGDIYRVRITSFTPGVEMSPIVISSSGIPFLTHQRGTGLDASDVASACSAGNGLILEYHP